LIIGTPAFLQEYPFKERVDKAELLRAESKYDSALIVYNEIDSMAFLLGNFEYKVRVLIGSGSVFFELGQPKVARDNYFRALSYAKNIGNELLENNALYGIGGSYHFEGNLDSAIYYYDLTKDRFIEQGNLENAAGLIYNMSIIYMNQQKYDLALSGAKQSLSLRESISSNREIGRTNRMIGDLFERIETPDSARQYYIKAYLIADSLGFSEDARQTLNQMATLELKQENFEQAYEYRVKSDSIAQKIFVEGENDEILNLREKYNTATLELENERQKNIAEQQRKSKFIILSVALVLIMIISVWLYIVDQRRKNMKLLAEKNEEINKQQIDDLLQEQEIASLQGVLQGQETERKRVAMDLHDRLGGMLSMVKLHFSAFEEKIDTVDLKSEKFVKASELLDQATKEVRNISHDLLSGVLTKFGLVPALEELKDKISSTGKVNVGLYANDLKGALNAEQELQLYRIVQELLSNILKHAKAKGANIQLNRSGDSLNLIVEDDGIGFKLSEANDRGGIGLINLKARVAKLNGSFHIDSGKGGGTTISIDIPLNND
jgi:signal transduction histidine kinase